MERWAGVWGGGTDHVPVSAIEQPQTALYGASCLTITAMNYTQLKGAQQSPKVLIKMRIALVAHKEVFVL